MRVSRILVGTVLLKISFIRINLNVDIGKLLNYCAELDNKKMINGGCLLTSFIENGSRITLEK